MQIIQLIVLVFTFGIKLFDLWNEKDKELAAKKKRILNDGLKALENNDLSGINKFFDRINRGL